MWVGNSSDDAGKASGPFPSALALYVENIDYQEDYWDTEMGRQNNAKGLRFGNNCEGWKK